MRSRFVTAVLLPLALATAWLGMGLSLVPADLQRLMRHLRAVAGVRVCQTLALPPLGALIALQAAQAQACPADLLE